MQIFVGRTVRSSHQGQVRSWKWFSIHPDYRGKGGLAPDQSYDAAVIKLSRPVSGITPIKLATSKQNYLEKPGRNATVAGWGNTFANPPDPPGEPSSFLDRMHEAQVPIVSDSRAEQAYDPRPETKLTRGLIYSPPLQIAAGGNGKDACQADSGGPMFLALAPGGGDNGDDVTVEVDSGAGDVEVAGLFGDVTVTAGAGDDGDNGGSSGKYTQIGITSFGLGCAYKDFPGVYTEVNNPSVRSFITKEASR